MFCVAVALVVGRNRVVKDAEVQALMIPSALPTPGTMAMQVLITKYGEKFHVRALFRVEAVDEREELGTVHLALKKVR